MSPEISLLKKVSSVQLKVSSVSLEVSIVQLRVSSVNLRMSRVCFKVSSVYLILSSVQLESICQQLQLFGPVDTQYLTTIKTSKIQNKGGKIGGSSCRKCRRLNLVSSRECRTFDITMSYTLIQQFFSTFKNNSCKETFSTKPFQRKSRSHNGLHGWNDQGFSLRPSEINAFLLLVTEWQLPCKYWVDTRHFLTRHQTLPRRQQTLWGRHYTLSKRHQTLSTRHQTLDTFKLTIDTFKNTLDTNTIHL